MAISALSELIEELKTLLAPQEHKPFSVIWGRPPRSPPHFLLLIGIANTHFPYQQASISASGARNLVEHHTRLRCSFSAKTIINIYKDLRPRSGYRQIIPFCPQRSDPNPHLWRPTNKIWSLSHKN